MAKLVRVTAEDIRRGQRQTATRCPLALACTRAYRREVFVDCLSLRFADCLNYVRLSKAAQRFIRGFDEHGPKAVKPCRLHIPL